MALWRVSLLALLVLIVDGCGSVSKLGNAFSRSTYQLRPYKEIQLKDGLKVLLIPDQRLPSFSIQLLVKNGSSADPKDLPGVTQMMAQLMDQGTAQRSASEIADAFGQLGTEFSRSVDKDYMLFGTTGLSQHQAVLIKNFFEIVTDPTFSEQELTRMRSRLVAHIKQSLDDPDGFANRAFDSYIFGDQPYGRPTSGTLDSLKRMGRKQVIRQYLNYVRPNNSVLAVVGQYDDSLQTQLEEATKLWTSRDVKPIEEGPVPEIKGRKLLIIRKDDLKQAQVRFGHQGIQRTDPDFLTLRLANAILGVSFDSRLAYEVRQKRGLTYSIHSGFDARKGQGDFEISTFTRLDKIGELVKVTLQTLEEFKAKGVTEPELESAKNFLKGVFPQVLETSESLARNLLILRFYGISDSFLTNYFQNLDSITLAQVNAAIKTHFFPENIKIQLFAPQKTTEPQLLGIGDIEVKQAKDLL